MMRIDEASSVAHRLLFAFRALLVAVVATVVVGWRLDRVSGVVWRNARGAFDEAGPQDRERAPQALRKRMAHGTARQADDAPVAFQVDINPEARVKLRERTPPQRLVRQQTQRFRVEVHNEAGLTAPLQLRAFDRSQPGEQEAGWFHVGFVENGESTSLLSGARTEWKLIELRCDEAGTRTVRFAADAGTGTQDLGFRAEVDLVIDVEERP